MAIFDGKLLTYPRCPGTGVVRALLVGSHKRIALSESAAISIITAAHRSTGRLKRFTHPPRTRYTFLGLRHKDNVIRPEALATPFFVSNRLYRLPAGGKKLLRQ